MIRPVLAVAFVVAVLLSSSACGSGRASGPAADQEDFGVRMAKMNLWREAMFRFKRAVELNPGDAMAHNNLAVAYEANGDFDNAAKAYREAMRLDKSNQHIQKNYSRFVEFTTRDRRRQQRRPAAQAATAVTTQAAEPAETPAPAGDAPAVPPPASSPEPPPASASEPDATPAADPSPAAASPAETPAPNPAPPQPVPQPAPNPPGGAR